MYEELKLIDWYLAEHKNINDEKTCTACGIVTGHKRIAGGTFVHTSSILGIEFDTAKNKFLIETYSGNHYELLLTDINFNYFNQTEEYLKEFNISIPGIDKCRELKETFNNKCLKDISSILEAGELYLSCNGTYTKHAVFKNEDGYARYIPVSSHVGMFQDSYLVVDNEKREVDFRYFDRTTAIEPYHWSDGLRAVKIKNTGTEPISFKGTKREIICDIEKITIIQSNEYTGEGLMTPDVVNGKCALLSSDLLTNNESLRQQNEDAAPDLLK